MGLAEIEYFLPWVLLGYLFGSCPTGYLLVRVLKGRDVRNFGSGNIGATNVSRVIGRGWAVFTAVADMFKGGAAMLVTLAFRHDDPVLSSLVAAASVIGHSYPVWIGFKGGKGVATSFGVIGCFDFFNPAPAILGGVVWFVAREISCMVSLASMVSLAAAAVFVFLFALPDAYFVCGFFLFVFSVWKHRENIKRIMARKENKIEPFFPRRGEKAKESS